MRARATLLPIEVKSAFCMDVSVSFEKALGQKKKWPFENEGPLENQILVGSLDQTQSRLAGCVCLSQH